MPTTTQPRGHFYQQDTHVRYRRLLADGTIWHDIGIHCDVEQPRAYVCEILGNDERQHLPEDTYENHAHLYGLFEAARMARDEQDRAKSGDLEHWPGGIWGATSHNAHGYRP